MGFLGDVVSSAIQKRGERQEMCAQIMSYFLEHDEEIAQQVSKGRLTLIGSKEIFGYHLTTEDFEKVVSYLDKDGGYYCVQTAQRTFYMTVYLGSLSVKGFDGPSPEGSETRGGYGSVTEGSDYGYQSYDASDDTGYGTSVRDSAPKVKRQRKPLTLEQKEAMLEKRRISLEKKKRQEEREEALEKVKEEAVAPIEKRRKIFNIIKWVLSVAMCYFSIMFGIAVFVVMHFGLNKYFESAIEKAEKKAVETYDKEHPEE